MSVGRLIASGSFAGRSFTAATQETIWGTWPTDELSLAINESSFNQLRPLGAFDVWIAEAQPPTGRLGQKELLGQLSYFNVTWR